MRILFLGDVVGRTGREVVTSTLPGLRERWALDFVIVNGENAAAGFGISEKITETLLDAGADVITTGNHVWDQRDALVFIERQERLLRPINYPRGTPGRGAGVFKGVNGHDVLVINPMGRVFMADLDDPFGAADKELEACPLGQGCDACVIDFHAEATSEKQAMGHYTDGRASLVIGTHTHTPTADARVLPGGTAYMTDAGMCGDYTSVVGMEAEESVRRFVTRIPKGRFQPAGGPATLSGLLVETDPGTGLALRCGPVRMGGALSPTQPDWADPSAA